MSEEACRYTCTKEPVRNLEKSPRNQDTKVLDYKGFLMVGATGIEPVTPTMSTFIPYAETAEYQGTENIATRYFGHDVPVLGTFFGTAYRRPLRYPLSCPSLSGGAV